MGWDGPILTDSGGFQVFSLRDTIARASTTRASRSARSTTATPARFTPELAAAIQAQLGSDIAMCLDVCPPAGVPRAELEEAVRRTTRWAARQREAPRAPGQLVFGIAQGGTDPRAARAARSQEIAALGFDGNALGGLSRRRGPRPTMFETVAGRRRCCRPTGRATSWASATRRASSR